MSDRKTRQTISSPAADSPQPLRQQFAKELSVQSSSSAESVLEISELTNHSSDRQLVGAPSNKPLTFVKTIKASTATNVVTLNDSPRRCQRSKPKLFRQSNAEYDVSSNRSLSAPSSESEELNAKSNNSPVRSRSPASKVVPQVSVTLSSPDNPKQFPINSFDGDYDQRTDYVDSSEAATLSEHLGLRSDSSLASSSERINSISSRTQSIEEGTAEGIDPTSKRAKDGQQRTRYITKTLALLKLQSRFRKSRSEDTGNQSRPMVSPVETGSTFISRDSQPNKSCSSVSLYRETTSGPAINEDQDPFILGIHIHNTDRKLRSSSKCKSIVHPVVKVHIIDSSTGVYLVKKHANRDVTSFYETSSGNNKLNFILPVMTQKCDLLSRIRYPRYPIWEELLLYNEDYSYFLRENVIIFFEVKN